MEIFAVKWNVVSEISKVLLNDIFAELEGNSGIKNIITTDRVHLGGLQVCRLYICKNYGIKYEEIILTRYIKLSVDIFSLFSVRI